MDFEVDFSDIGRMPWITKLILILCLCAAILGAGYWFIHKDQLVALSRAEGKEKTLKASYIEKWGLAANLDAYKQQMNDIEKTFGTMLKQLPKQTEVADLLVEVSQTGLASGLEFTLFQPTKEIPKEFYAEKPINIKVTGTYHELGNFVSGVAALARIVTLHNLVMKPIPQKNLKSNKAKVIGNTGSDGVTLEVSLLAKTYRYIDPDEETKSSSKRRKKRKGT